MGRAGVQAPLGVVMVALAAGALLVLASPRQASAQEGLEAVLQGLKWRASKAEVLKFYKAQKDAEFKEEAKAERDSILKEKLRRKKQEEYKAIEESWVELKGTRTGYEVSVISGEYEKDGGEALLRIKDERAQKFYFFENERLWKMAIVYNQDYLSGIGFEAFVEQVARKYGESDESEYDADGYLARSMWRDQRTELRIEDKSDFFGTFVMVFSDVETTTRKRERQDAFAASEPKTDIRGEIKSIQEDDGFASDSNIVDRLVGQNIEVNLDRGKPEEHEVRRVGSKPAEDEEVKKKKKAAAKAKGPKKKSTRKADDLLIY